MKPNASRKNAKANGRVGAMERAAADWQIRRDRGLSPAQAEDLARWLDADPRHAAVLAELDETWRLLGQLQDVPHADQIGRRPRWLVAWLPAAVGIAAAVACAAWWHASTERADRFHAVAVTEPGTLRRMELPDGSVLQLNEKSSVAVDFTHDERRVQLVGGEVHLAVAKNRSRPFIVSVGDVAVRAVGTAFAVRLKPAEAVEVVVTEGKVRVDDVAKQRSLLANPGEGKVPLLVAGQRARIELPSTAIAPRATAAKVVSLAPAEIEETQAWHTRQLKFGSVPLAEIVAQFNRYNSHQLAIADPELGTKQFGGTFLAGDYQTFVRLLGVNFGVRVELQGDTTILRLR